MTIPLTRNFEGIIPTVYTADGEKYINLADCREPLGFANDNFNANGWVGMGFTRKNNPPSMPFRTKAELYSISIFYTYIDITTKVSSSVCSRSIKK